MARVLLCAVCTVSAACSESPGPQPAGRGTPETRTSVEPTPTDAPEADRLPPKVHARPAWLGKRVLPLDADGLGIARKTPALLRDRRLVTEDFLPPPKTKAFLSKIGAVPNDVLERSTWRRLCPVGVDDLAYVTVSFWGFDKRPHTGELLVHRSVSRDVVSVFRSLYVARWPLEEMRITTRKELDAPPTGDGNNTGSFVCRPARLSATWSEHAYGLAIDVNPFHNPYVRDGLVLPERALAYRNREWRRPGMIRAGDVVTEAFDRIGWGWGGSWTSSKDWMHFSRSGR